MNYLLTGLLIAFPLNCIYYNTYLFRKFVIFMNNLGYFCKQSKDKNLQKIYKVHNLFIKTRRPGGRRRGAIVNIL